MSSTNGLVRISATSIDNSGEIRLGTNINPGTAGQVIKSQGENQPAIWENETAHTNQPLTMGNNLTLASGNLSYDGSVAETIDAGKTPTPGQLQLGFGMKFSSTSTFYDGSLNEIINAYGADYFKDNSTGYLYKQLKPSNFVMDDDSGGDNRWVISDGVNTEGQAVNRGANATQIYAYFDIPSGYRFTGYRLNLNNSAGNATGGSPSTTFYTRAGFMLNTGPRTWVNTLGGQGYNAHIALTGTQPTNNWSVSWGKGDAMIYGLLMCYRLYWTSGFFFPGGYVEFQPI